MKKAHIYTKLLAICMIVTGTICCYSMPLAVADIAPVSCNSLNAAPNDNQSYYTLTAASSGDPTNITGYMFSFGDNQSYTVTFDPQTSADRNNIAVKHTYQKTGNYTASARVITKVGKDVTSATCQANVPVGMPATLPDTGATGMLGAFVAATVVGTSVYWLHLKKQHASR